MSDYDEILRLSDAYYRLVSKDHHKERDCHWYVQLDFAYGDEPTYLAYHEGYVSDFMEAKADSYEGALAGLVYLLKRAFRDRQAWARTVIREGIKGGWGEGQVKEAKEWLAVKI